MLIPQLKVMISREPADFRKSYDGLCGIVRDVLGADPMEPMLFVFRNRRGDQLKILWYDHNGYAIWMKRLSKGTFLLPKSGEEISAYNLAGLMRGGSRIS